MAEVAD